jgi:MYXO-CTERM domain-containing protein
MMNFSKLIKTGVAVAAFAAMGSVYAAPCGSGLDTTDVTYGVNYDGTVASAQSATTCVGPIDGNLSIGAGGGGNYGTADVNDLLGQADEYVGGVADGGSVTINLFGVDITFTLSPESGDQNKSGDYLLTATSAGGALFPPSIFLDFAVNLKGSDSFALYFFDDREFDGSGGGTWKISFLNNGGKIPGLSHMEIFFREGSSTSSQSSQSSLTVSEPGSSSLALMGLGLLAGSFVLRRRSLGR